MSPMLALWTSAAVARWVTYGIAALVADALPWWEAGPILLGLASMLHLALCGALSAALMLTGGRL